MVRKPLQFHEGKACDAIIRYLEFREGAARTGLLLPEAERHPAPVEVVCTIGRHLFAVEHTGIEPFAGFMRLQNDAARIIQPIIDGVSGRVPLNEDFELCIETSALEGLNQRQVKEIQERLVAWIIGAAPALSIPPRGRKDTTVRPTRIPGVPFPVKLYRMAGLVHPGRVLPTFIVTDLEAKREQRIATALAKKMSKLAWWKREAGAKAVLVLENNDIALTNAHYVTDAVLKGEQSIESCADEVYLVSTFIEPWRGHFVRVDGSSYFDLTDPDKRSWEVDPSALLDLTGH